MIDSLKQAVLEEVLALPRCEHCNRLQFPIDEFCGNCFSSDLTWQKISPNGVVIADTKIHYSLDPHFKAALPTHIGLIKMDSGPIIYALLIDDVSVDKSVCVSNQLDHRNQPIFTATVSANLDENI